MTQQGQVFPKPIPKLRRARQPDADFLPFQRLSVLYGRGHHIEPLPLTEVLDALNLGNKDTRFAGILESSPGLEPGTAPLPCT